MIPEMTVKGKRIIIQFISRLNLEGKVEESPGKWISTLWLRTGQNCEDPEWDFEMNKDASTPKNS